MGSSTEVQVDLSCVGAADLAAHWLPRFYAGVSVILVGDRATLESDAHSVPELQAIWYAALANESLFVEAAAHRARALEALTR